MNRLRAYRRLEGVDVATLAGRLGVSVAQAAGLESGRVAGSECDLAALGYSQARFEVAEMTGLMHRQRPVAPAPAKRYVQEVLRLAGEAFGALAVVDGCRVERLGPLLSLDDAADAAADVRAVLGFSPRQPATALAEATEKAGAVLVPLPASSWIDAMSCWVGTVPLIGVGVLADEPQARLRVAHEIGHLVLHTQSSGYAEDEAERFAAALLMPDDAFDDAITATTKVRDLVEVEAMWGIPGDALLERAQLFDAIDPERISRLRRSLAARSRRSGNPAPARWLRGRRLEDLIVSAGGHLVCAQRLGLNEDHLRAVTNWGDLTAL